MRTFYSFLFVLGVLVFVHELGHFLLARWHGVRVLTFSLGFGPKLLKFTRGDTEYCVSAIPLGGYVKMAGETPEDDTPPRHDEFFAKTKWQRFQIYLAGPAMNVIAAILIMVGVFLNGASEPAYKRSVPIVGRVEKGSPAELAGIRPGDRIVRMAGYDTPDWNELHKAMRADDREEYLRRALALRVACYEGAGKPRLLDRFLALYDHSMRYHFLTIADVSRFERSRRNMERFYAACRKRDGIEAQGVIEEALLWTLSSLTEAFVAADG